MATNEMDGRSKGLNNMNDSYKIITTISFNLYLRYLKDLVYDLLVPEC